MRHVLARSVLVASIAAGTVSGTALGHECLVANRSDTGNIAAGDHSPVWTTFGTSTDFIVAVGQFLGLPPLTDTQLAWAVETAGEAGLPDQLTIFVGNHTIAEGTPAMERDTGNGQGIDHLYDWFPIVAAIYADALAH
jgi:hypothetical protein